MHRPLRLSHFSIAVVVAALALWPADAFAQHARGGSRGGGQGHVSSAGRATPAARGSAAGPSHATPRPPGGTRYAVPRTRPPYYGHGGYYPYRPYYPYYGWGWGIGWGWGGSYYPPFMSVYGWYPYGFGWYYPPYPYYGYGAYDTTASVRIQVTPREAEVYVDGYYAGVVDDFDGTFQRLNLLPGNHEITVYMAGYKSASERRYFRPHAGYKIKASLEKLAPGQQDEPKPQPSAQASSPPRGAGEPDPWDVESARRAPEPRWPEPVAEPRTAPPGAPPMPASSDSPQAERAPRSSFGSLAIRVQPGGATVVIDGERWQGPAVQDRLVVELADGRHTVEISKDGYTPYSAEVDIRAGERNLLNVSLPPADRQ